jgi:hypothetical protein
MLRRPDESAFTIDGYVNRQSDSQEAASGIAESVVQSCESYGFAILRNTFSPQDFTMLKQECLDTFDELEAKGGVRRCDPKEAAHVIKTSEKLTELSDKTRDLLGGFAMELFKASGNALRMRTPDTILNAAFVAKYEPHGKVTRHRDAVTGVMCDTSLEGRALMGFWRGARKLGDVVLCPNDTVIMPARTLGNARHRLIKHDVINITRSENDSTTRGSRYSLIFNYGRTHHPEVLQ